MTAEPPGSAASADQALAEQRRRQVEDAVRTWTGQLIDLGGRNQLLYYRDLKVGTLDFADANPTAVEDLMDGRRVRLSRLFDDEVLPDRLKRARAIRNKAREALEERGIATCFLAVGMATWTNTLGTATPAAPVLLREATIAATGAAEDDFELAVTGETEINPTLVHMLAEQYQVTLPDDVEDLIPPGQFDPQQVFDRLHKECATVSGFGITRRTVLGTFSYAKLPMVTDLNANLEALIAHDVVAAIAGNRPAQLGISAAGSNVDLTDPDRRPPADEFLVLDADSSQSYVINAVVAGQSLVVSGPPGTGKSQTIGNLIASLVARGQSVLFVAEKRAAIAAVLDRLNRVGLADLVLDLHGGAGSRRALAESLATGLRAASSVARPDQTALHRRLVERRDRLNTHAGAMHTRRIPWDVSVFDAQCTLIALRDRHGQGADTSVRLRGDVLIGLDGAGMRQVSNDLYEFAGLGGLTLTKSESLWADAPITSVEQAEAALEAASRLLTHTAPTARHALDEVVRQTGLRPPRTLTEWSDAFELLDGVATALTDLRPDAFHHPQLPELVAATSPRSWRKQHRDWPGATAGWSERRRLRKAAEQLAVGTEKPSKTQLHQTLAAAYDLGLRWRQHSTDGGPPRVPQALADTHGRFDQLTRELAALGAYLSGTEFSLIPTHELEPTLSALARDERTLRKMPRLNELAQRFRRAGLEPLISELRTRRLDPTLAVAAFENCWYQSILDKAGFEDPDLATFDAALHDSHAAGYRDDDTAHIAHSAARVRRAAAEWLVTTRDECDEQSTLVAAQAARKRGHLPLRQLFAAAPDVMTALKPCWAMSPLVVSQLLPGDRPYFDVVVFDEASQIVPADAIPAILRARRVVVAGDRHQLPPTSFFATASEGDTDVEDAVTADGSINLALTSGFESILDVLTAGLGEGRNRSLTWHYRSHDERLIAFSNAWVYDNSLTTFPGIAGSQCLSHELVAQQPSAAGQEDSVTAEVDRVVDLILNHAAARPRQTLGVITMGIKHADRIDVRLRERLRDRRDLHPFFDESVAEKFFVKNLERVQGDERDAIILSIGYGKSPDGRLLYRFGPLLQEGGHRRLNVAVTRARSRMTLVSSFSHHDMDPNRSSAPGVQMLRAYLQYAASGGEHLGDAALQQPALNPFEISVRDRLVAAGIPLVAQYGVAGYWIDFAAQHPTQPGKMVLAIEADGASYHSSPTARDRDRLRQEQLERLGWSFHRIWSTEWFTDTDACIAKAQVAYRRAVAAADAEDQSGRSLTRRPVPTPQRAPSAPTPARRVGARPPVPPGYPITEYRLDELVDLIGWIESDTLLRTEDELFDEFMRELGFQRRGSRIRDAFNRALADSRRRLD